MENGSGPDVSAKAESTGLRPRKSVGGNARRGNPRDANRDADAERLGTRKGELRGNAKVQRQKSYLRARPCLVAPHYIWKTNVVRRD